MTSLEDKAHFYQHGERLLREEIERTEGIETRSCPEEPVRWHEYANLFPMLNGEPFDALVEDIKQNGVREPIVMLDSTILDGRNRYMAARQLGIEYPVKQYQGDNPLAFVISHNLHRRHLSESQRAMVAGKLANLKRTDTLIQNRGANLPNGSVTNTAAAELLNVSERSVKTARKVRDKADESLIEAVESGAVSVSAAADVAELPKPEQAEIVARGEVLDAAKEIREGRKPFVANNSGQNEWYTPDFILDAAREVLGGIDFDPASSAIANERVRADKFFTAEDDALSQEWPVGRIWMNPPYARDLVEPFFAKFLKTCAAGATGIALTNNGTETGWFQDAASAASAVCFPKGRVRYLNAEGEQSGAPLQGQAIFYLGQNPDAFRAAFSTIGVVLS